MAWIAAAAYTLFTHPGWNQFLLGVVIAVVTFLAFKSAEPRIQGFFANTGQAGLDESAQGQS
jgi:uncharacterized membrane protein YccC